MPRKPRSFPNPKRQASGRRNRLLRGPLTPEGRERLPQSAIKHQPWKFSTGPRSDEGKARSAMNGRSRQRGEQSVRQFRAAVAADVRAMIAEMRVCRSMVESAG